MLLLVLNRNETCHQTADIVQSWKSKGVEIRVVVGQVMMDAIEEEAPGVWTRLLNGEEVDLGELLRGDTR